MRAPKIGKDFIITRMSTTHKTTGETNISVAPKVSTIDILRRCASQFTTRNGIIFTPRKDPTTVVTTSSSMCFRTFTLDRVDNSK